MEQPTILDNVRAVELFNDPIRFKILTELFFNREKTAKELLEVLPINRSTLSHHLTKMVSEKVLAVRINPTGRAIKYYSLKIPIHKIEARSSYNPKPDHEKTKVLKLLAQQIPFELKMATNLAEKYSRSILNQEIIENIEFSGSTVKYDVNHHPETIMNGGVFYTNKEHAQKFFKEIDQIITRFRNEVFDMSTDEKKILKDFAIVFAGFPLVHPIKVLAKRTKIESEV